MRLALDPPPRACALCPSSPGPTGTNPASRPRGPCTRTLLGGKPPSQPSLTLRSSSAFSIFPRPGLLWSSSLSHSPSGLSSLPGLLRLRPSPNHAPYPPQRLSIPALTTQPGAGSFGARTRIPGRVYPGTTGNGLGAVCVPGQDLYQQAAWAQVLFENANYRLSPCQGPGCMSSAASTSPQFAQIYADGLMLHPFY